MMIDGFPRSANSFALEGFLMRAIGDCKISSHHHAPLAVFAAVKMKKPVLIVIRDPYQAIAAYSLYNGYLSLGYCIETYLSYYSRIEPLREFVCFASFDEVIQRLDVVIRRVNRRFSTNFSEKEFDSDDHGCPE